MNNNDDKVLMVVMGFVFLSFAVLVICLAAVEIWGGC